MLVVFAMLCLSRAHHLVRRHVTVQVVHIEAHRDPVTDERNIAALDALPDRRLRQSEINCRFLHTQIPSSHVKSTTSSGETLIAASFTATHRDRRRKSRTGPLPSQPLLLVGRTLKISSPKSGKMP